MKSEERFLKSWKKMDRVKKENRDEKERGEKRKEER